MATLIDSNIFLDILDPRSSWSDWAAGALVAARRNGSLVYNVVIAAEVAYGFRNAPDFDVFIAGLPIERRDIPAEAAYPAAAAHRTYRSSGGGRARTLPDFLIGAHAEVEGHAIITRDPSGYRTYFPHVPLIAPDTHP